MQELRKGVWHWDAAHPDWKPGEEWDELVSSYAIDDSERLLLFDPLAPPNEIEELAATRETAIVLTCPWHARDAERLAERLGSTLYAPPPDEGDPNPLPAEVFREGDRLSVGVRAFRGMESNDLVLLVEAPGAVVAGDSLIDRGNGLEIPADWVGAAFERIRESLRPLLELPRSSSCSRRTAARRIEPRSSACSPDLRPDPPGGWHRRLIHARSPRRSAP